MAHETNNALHTRLIQTADEFATLQADWNRLSDESEYPNIFTTWEWLHTWWHWYGQNDPTRGLYLIVVEKKINSGTELLGIFPFYRTSKKRLFFLGYGARPCAEYLGPIIRKGHVDEVCDAVITFLRQNGNEWDNLFLEDYAKDDPGTLMFADRLKNGYTHDTEIGETRFIINLPETYDAYLASLNQHNRKRKKERINQARSRYSPEWEVVPDDRLEQWYQILVDLTTHARKKHGQNNPFLTKEYYGFHHDVCQLLCPQKHVLPSILKFDGKPVSTWYVYFYHGKCAAYQQGHDTEVKGSPSDVALQMLLMYLIENKCTEFDFLRGGEWYKTTYTSDSRPTETLIVFNKKNFDYYKHLAKKNIYIPLKLMAKKIIASSLLVLPKVKSPNQ